MVIKVNCCRRSPQVKVIQVSYKGQSYTDKLWLVFSNGQGHTDKLWKVVSLGQGHKGKLLQVVSTGEGNTGNLWQVVSNDIQATMAGGLHRTSHTGKVWHLVSQVKVIQVGYCKQSFSVR